MDMKLISTFVFGNKFSGFIDLLYTKMRDGDVVISEEDYRQYVDDSVFDLSVNVINFIQQFDVSSHLPTHPQTTEKPQAKKQATNNKCTFVLTRGPNKGNDCGKPAHVSLSSSMHGCNAHSAIMQKDVVMDADVTPTVSVKKSDAEKPGSVKKSDAEKPVAKKCGYIMSRGARAGERCDAVVKEGDMCAVHSKSKGPKKDVVPSSKSLVKVSKHEHVEKSKNLVTMVLRNDKTRGIIYHPSKGFVFKSKDNLCIIGRVTIENTKPSGDVRDLTKSDIEEIKTYELPDGGVFKLDTKYNQPIEDEGDISAIEDIINDMKNEEEEEDAEEEDAQEYDEATDEDAKAAEEYAQEAEDLFEEEE